jgi:hypothetical protein
MTLKGFFALWFVVALAATLIPHILLFFGIDTFALAVISIIGGFGLVALVFMVLASFLYSFTKT